MSFKPPGDCPVCGESVPKQAKACPGCGADARSGWQEEDSHDGLDLPDEEFDYKAFVADEFGDGRNKRATLHPVWWITAVVLIVLGVIAWVLGR